MEFTLACLKRMQPFLIPVFSLQVKISISKVTFSTCTKRLFRSQICHLAKQEKYTLINLYPPTVSKPKKKNNISFTVYIPTNVKNLLWEGQSQVTANQNSDFIHLGLSHRSHCLNLHGRSDDLRHQCLIQNSRLWTMGYLSLCPICLLTSMW